MNANRLQRLADALTAELDEFLTIKAEIVDAQARVSMQEPGVFELRAIGGILHDVYSGAESLCRHIAKEIDRRLPQGTDWHRDLLAQMAQPLFKTRPAVLQRETVVIFGRLP